MKCVSWLHHPHGHSWMFIHTVLALSSLKPHLLQRRVSLDLPIPFVGLPDSSLSDVPGFHISGRCWIDGCVCTKIQALGSNILCPGGSIWCRLQRFSPSAYISRASKGLCPWSFSTWGKVNLPMYLLGTHPDYLAFGSFGFSRSRLWCGGNIRGLLGPQMVRVSGTAKTKCASGKPSV